MARGATFLIFNNLLIISGASAVSLMSRVMVGYQGVAVGDELDLEEVLTGVTTLLGSAVWAVATSEVSILDGAVSMASAIPLVVGCQGSILGKRLQVSVTPCRGVVKRVPLSIKVGIEISASPILVHPELLL